MNARLSPNYSNTCSRPGASSSGGAIFNSPRTSGKEPSGKEIGRPSDVRLVGNAGGHGNLH